MRDLRRVARPMFPLMLQLCVIGLYSVVVEAAPSDGNHEVTYSHVLRGHERNVEKRRHCGCFQQRLAQVRDLMRAGFALLCLISSSALLMRHFAITKTSCSGAWSYRQVVLHEPFHLSYPFTFFIGNTAYMVPEVMCPPHLLCSLSVFCILHHAVLAHISCQGNEGGKGAMHV